MRSLITKTFRISHIILVMLIVSDSGVQGQSRSNSPMTKLVTLRNDFVARIKSMGFTPSLDAPKIVMDNPRSFGNYEIENNVLHTCDWNNMPPSAKDLFNNAAKSVGNGMTGQDYFEASVYKWIFVHELGHWWRACQHQATDPYENEKAANRIATAYWREVDPNFYAFKLKTFQHMVNTFPNPVPDGQSKETYLNNNYDKLPGASAYTWYQATMIVEVSNEQPAITFKQAIQNEGK